MLGDGDGVEPVSVVLQEEMLKGPHCQWAIFALDVGGHGDTAGTPVGSTNNEKSTFGSTETKLKRPTQKNCLAKRFSAKSLSSHLRWHVLHTLARLQSRYE